MPPLQSYKYIPLPLRKPEVNAAPWRKLAGFEGVHDSDASLLKDCRNRAAAQERTAGLKRPSETDSGSFSSKSKQRRLSSFSSSKAASNASGPSARSSRQPEPSPAAAAAGTQKWPEPAVRRRSKKNATVPHEEAGDGASGGNDDGPVGGGDPSAPPPAEDEPSSTSKRGRCGKGKTLTIKQKLDLLSEATGLEGQR